MGRGISSEHCSHLKMGTCQNLSLPRRSKVSVSYETTLIGLPTIWDSNAYLFCPPNAATLLWPVAQAPNLIL